MSARRRLLVPFLAAAIACAAPFVASGCGGDKPALQPSHGRYDATGRLVEGTRERVTPPNVVLLILDTTRADAISDAAGASPAMPNLLAFSKAATHFVDASAAAAWTAPSVTTTLTGLLPSEHGVQGRLKASPLVGDVATLAEILSEAGMQTLAFTAGGWVSREMGLGQGFSRFETDWATNDPKKSLARALDNLPRDKPVFLLLHTYEAHDPYGKKDPPEGQDDPERVASVERDVAAIATFIDRHEIDRMDLDLGRRLLLGFRGDPLFEAKLSARVPHERAGGAAAYYQWFLHPKDPHRATTETTLRDRYRRGLSLMDDHLPALFRRIDEAQLPGRTVTIVVSDHGEAFGEHGALGHGRWLYDVLTRVLLIVHAPGRMPAGPVRGSCGLVDVVPTVLDLCGLPPPQGATGRSLLAFAKGRGRGDAVPVVAEDFRGSPTTEEAAQTKRVVSVRNELGKAILTWDPRDLSVVEELFDLVADPTESKPLPAGEAMRFGKPFVLALAQARSRVAKFRPGGESLGDGTFSER